MSRLVNFIFDGVNFVGIEDVRTGRSIAVGKTIDLEDGLTAIQVRVLDNHLADNEGNIIAAPGAVKVEPVALNAPDRCIQPEIDLQSRRSLP